MLGKLFMITFRNMFRSGTRLLITSLGCAVAAFVICFLLSAEHSINQMTDSAGRDANIIVREKDRY